MMKQQNNWTENKNGESYLLGISGRAGRRLAASLRDSHRPEFENWGKLFKEVVKMDFIVEVIEGVDFRKGVPPYVILTVIFTGLVLFF